MEKNEYSISASRFSFAADHGAADAMVLGSIPIFTCVTRMTVSTVLTDPSRLSVSPAVRVFSHISAIGIKLNHLIDT